MQRNEFYKSTKEQPHKDRAKQIMAKHPEITQLIGRNPYTFLILLLMLGIQIGIATWVGSLGFSGYWWVAIIIAYAIGAFCNHNLYAIIHEGTHNLIFKNRTLNKLSVILADLVNIVPGAMGFATYHLKHHAYMGDHDLDADMATMWEAKVVKNIWWRKAIWLMFFPVWQVLRTTRIKAVYTFHPWMVFNVVVIFAFDAAVVYFLGWNALFYFGCSMLFALGLHPLGARWIQEHFTLIEDQETYSYYGWINKIALNIGYHNEHHDFPSIPWNKLPQIRAMAPEFYNTVKYHESWSGLLKEFIFNKEYSLYQRVER